MTTVTTATGAEATLADIELTFGTDADLNRWRADSLAAGWTVDGDGRLVANYPDLPPVALRLTVR